MPDLRSFAPADRDNIAGEEPQDLTLGDHQPQAGQQGRDPIDRHLPLVMLQQDEAHQLWPEMTAQVLMVGGR